MAGSGVGGILVPLVSAPITAAADALSYLCSAALLARTPRPPSVAAPRRASPFSVAGLQFIATTHVLRGALGVTTTTNFFNLMFHALLVLFLAHTLNLAPGTIGVVLAAETAGALAGSTMAPAIVGRLGRRRGLVLGSLLLAAPLVVVAAAIGPGAIVVTDILAASLVSGLGRSLQDITVATIFMSTVPVALRSQVRGAYQLVSFGVRPVGAVLGGIAGQQLGVRTAICAAAFGGLLAFLWALPSREPTCSVTSLTDRASEAP